MMTWLAKYLICFGALASGRQSPGTVADDSPLVVVYYENWAGWVRNFSPSHVEKNILSRNMPVRNFVINYAFYTWNYNECSLIPVDSIDLQKGDKGGWTPDDWNIDSTESWATSKPAGGHIPAFMMLKSYYPHIKLLPSIGGWSRSNTYHDCLTTKMDHMIETVIDHIIVWGWDGIDLDWEYPNCDGKPCGCQNEAVCLKETGFSNVAGTGDWEIYKTFVKKVRQQFNDLEDKIGRRLYITAALGMNPKLVDGNNDQWSTPMPLEWICEEDDFDWVNLMAYDFYGPWSQLTGPLAPLYPQPEITDQMSIDDSLTRILSRCSKPEKLTMGLATYGKAWQEVPNTGSVPGLWQTSTAADPRGGGTWEMGTLSYFDLKKNIIPACTKTWDPVSQTPTLYCSQLPLAADLPSDDKTGPVARGQSNVFISYEDGESWKIKMAYARAKGMAGAIIWAASDTGCGESFAPDSTVDLFEGLLEGWFGEKHTLPASTSIKPSPGELTRPANYPCPMVTGWPTGSAEIDMSRCQGLTYPVGGDYLKIPKASSQSNIGENKILIHPLGSTPTNPPVTTPTTVATTPAPVTTPSTPPATLATTTPASNTIIADCQAAITGDGMQRARFCQENCSTVSSLGLCPNDFDGESLAICVASIINICQSQKIATTTPAPSQDVITGCQSLITAPNPARVSLCKRNCATVLAHGACPDSGSATSVAQCVASTFSYCALATN